MEIPPAQPLLLSWPAADAMPTVMDLLANLQLTHQIQSETVTQLTEMRCLVASLSSIVGELCMDQGVPLEQYDLHIDTRFQIFRDRMLTSLEATHPAAAARFDTRMPNEVPVSDLFPPLFPRD